MSTVNIENLSLIYHSKEDETLALKDLTMNVEDGELVGIVGPSGCGKTTVLSLVAGLLKPSSGKITIDGKPISECKHYAGYMLQHDQLFPWRTIWKNITLGLELKGEKKDPLALRFADELIEKYGLKDFVKKHPSQLSGGMRQRAALIRTLTYSPKILLLDEPFSALDFQTRLKVCDDVHSIIKREGKTALFVTHDISEAISVSDKIYILSKRPAHVRELVDLSDFKKLSPLERRQSKEFSDLFELIWSNL